MKNKANLDDKTNIVYGLTASKRWKL